MFLKLHLFSQDSPDGEEQFRFRPHPYLRMVGSMPKGPVTFKWSERQLDDLEELWVDPEAEGARSRLAKDLCAFAEKLGWVPDADKLEEAEDLGEEVLVTLNSAAQELYILPWEILRIGQSDCFLADFACTLVRYSVPGLGVRDPLETPPNPGVLFAWSAAGGAVPHEEQGKSISVACKEAKASFKEVANVDEASLQAALEDDPPSVLHLLCHGMPGPEGEPPRLSWGASDNARVVTATRLARMLRRSKKAIRLVVLSACGSGDSQQDVMFMSSLAQELHKKGIPNVVASRYPLSVRGSQVLVKQLYSKLLIEAWSLERSLRFVRDELFKADDEGRSYSGDAYGMQLYAYDTEKFVSANGVEAERPVLATYPFGTAELPTPASRPPRKDMEIEFEVATSELEAGKEELLEKLRKHAEDESLTFEVADEKAGGKGKTKLSIETTVDGAQRLVASWRSEELQEDTGFKVRGLKVAKKVKTPLTMAAAGHQLAKAVGVSGLLLKGSGKAAATKSTAAAAGKGLAAKVAIGAVVTGAAVTGGVVAMSGDDEPKEPAPVVQEAFLDAAAPPPDAPLPLATVAIQDTASYLDRTKKVQLSWITPDNAAGFLVVTSQTGEVVGEPEQGRKYKVGETWPGGGDAVVTHYGPGTELFVPLDLGATLWVRAWAYNAHNRYGISDETKFDAPKAGDAASP